MKVVKKYLDMMFKDLPQTEKVFKAKQELLQMMEDKYTELINAGKSENEAVGTVISEFGNLDELADSLGIADDLRSLKENSSFVKNTGAGASDQSSSFGNGPAEGSFYEKKEIRRYTNKKAALIMSVFWPSITCIYLIWSFITFNWEYTWIIWPVAAVVRKILYIIFSTEENYE